MDNKILKILINSGAIGIALALAFILYKVLTNDLTHIGSYIEKNTEVLSEVKGVVQANTAQALRLENVVVKLSDKIR